MERDIAVEDEVIDVEVGEEEESDEVSDEDDVMDIEVNGEEDDVMDIEVNDEEEMSDSDAILSEDSCYGSDKDETYTKIKWRVVYRAEINTLNSWKKMCAIHFFYMGENEQFCSRCIVNVGGLFSQLQAIRKHETDLHVSLRGGHCSKCCIELFQIIPCNMCPICTE